MQGGRHIDLCACTESYAIGIDEEEARLTSGGRIEREQSIDRRRARTAHAADDVAEAGCARGEHRRIASADAEAVEAMKKVAACELALRFSDRVYVARYQICAAIAYDRGIARSRAQNAGGATPTRIGLDARSGLCLSQRWKPQDCRGDEKNRPTAARGRGYFDYGHGRLPQIEHRTRTGIPLWRNSP